MADTTSPQPPPASDPLAEIAEVARAEHLTDRSRTGARRIGGRAITLGAVRACCAGLLLGGLLPTLIILAAWVAGAAARMSATPDPGTPLGRDPVRWRVEQYLRHFPLEACPLGFAVGSLAWCAAVAARHRAERSGRRSPWARILVGLLVAAYLGAAGARWYSMLPEAPKEEGIRIRHDPIEDDPPMKPILAAADREMGQKLANDPPEMKNRLGYCHRAWGVKKSILREKYGIDWRTPAEMNPNVAFD